MATGSLDIVAGPETLDEIGAVLEFTWSVHAHVPPEVRMHMAIAVSEIAANIVEHTAQDEPVNVHMEIQVLHDQVHVLFSDDGGPAGVDLDTAKMPATTAERGRGIALAKSVLQKLGYYRDSLNRWTLISRSFSAI